MADQKPLMIAELQKFYETFTPNYVGAFEHSWIELTDGSKKYDQKPMFEQHVSTWEQFLEFMRENSSSMLYSCYRPLRPLTRRNMNNVVSSKYFFVDIDDKTQDSKFLDLMKVMNLRYSFKSDSGGGFHYFIPHTLYDLNDDNKIERFKNASTLLRDMFIDSDVMIDKKVFDLARFTRPWGTFNYKRDKYCSLIESVDLSEKAIESNTSIIFGLQPKYTIDIRSPHTVWSHCKLIDRASEFNFEAKNPEAFVNDVLLKNTAAYIVENKRLEKEAYLVCKVQTHPFSEMEGWLKRAMKGHLKFNCVELRKFCKEYFPEFTRELCHTCMMENKNNIIYLNDETKSFRDLKNEYRETMKLPINRYYQLRGDISQDVAYMKTVTVAKRYLRMNDKSEKTDTVVESKELTAADMAHSHPNSYYVRYINEQALTKQELKELKMAPIGDERADFYIYNFCSENRCYKLLSEQPLDTGEAYIEGNMLMMPDKLKIGEKTELASFTNIFLLHNYKSTIAPFTDWESVFKDFNHSEKEIEDFIFHLWLNDREQYILDQPELFKWLIKAFMFSGQRENYPLHLVMVGPAGSGKSWIAEALHQKMGESGHMVDAATSTVKGFIPANPNGRYSSGCLYRAKRLMAADEFFVLFKMMKKDENAEELLQKFNNILMNKQLETNSGYGLRNERLTCKTVWTSNPMDIAAKDFIYSINKFPPPSMQRFLFYNQSRKFVEFIMDSHLIKAEIPNINKKKWLSLWDFFMSKNSNIVFDEKKVIDIIDRYKNICSNSVGFLYEHRTIKHHALLVFEGLVRWRIVFEKDRTITANDKDYDLFERVWEDIVMSWQNHEKKDKIAGLSRNERKIYELIPDDGISRVTLYKRAAEILNMTNPLEDEEVDRTHPVKMMIKELRKFKLIKSGEGGQVNAIFKVMKEEVKPSEMEFMTI